MFIQKESHSTLFSHMQKCGGGILLVEESKNKIAYEMYQDFEYILFQSHTHINTCTYTPVYNISYYIKSILSC